MAENNNYHILIVDDNADSIQLLTTILEMESYRVSSVMDGEDALTAMEANDYDLVLLDVKLYEMDGYQVCREMRKNDRTKDIPVVFISNMNDIESVVKGFNAGGQDYITKVSSPIELLARVRTHLELHWSRKELRLANEELRKANYQKRAFLGMAAHDLRSPLTTIICHTDFVKSIYKHDNELKNHLQKIETSSEQMLDLINELLENAANESGKRLLKKSLIDVSQLASAVVEYNTPHAQKKKQEIHTFFGDDCTIMGDKVIVQDIIENLVCNAVKYTPYFGKIEVAVSKANKVLCVRVSDNGPGLTDNDKKKLFGKFRKLSAKPTGGEVSTGLGLAITKDLVQLHGGSISVESEHGHGASFIVHLPEDN